jgi:hypothetical protein
LQALRRLNRSASWLAVFDESGLHDGVPGGRSCGFEQSKDGDESGAGRDDSWNGEESERAARRRVVFRARFHIALLSCLQRHDITFGALL